MTSSRDERVSAADTVILVDFDGTITEHDVGVVLLQRYSTTDWECIETRFAAGELDIVQNMQEQFSYVPYDADTLVQYARSRITIRPGWEDLVRRCQAHGLQVVVVSGGLDFYVEALLPPSEPPIEVHCLVTEYGLSGWRVTAPGGDPSGSEPTEFKQAIVKRYRQRYRHIWFVGNGVSDRGAAQVADKVWAVEPLLSYCRDHGIEAIPFETFGDVWTNVERFLAEPEVEAGSDTE